MAGSAKTVIRKMYDYCNRAGLLSDSSKKIMQDYFARTSRLKPRKRKSSKAKL